MFTNKGPAERGECRPKAGNVPSGAGPFLVNTLRKHFARKKAPAAKTSGGGAPKGRFGGFIRSILSLCFVKKWGDWQISAKVTFIRAKLPKIPKFPILLARSNRMSESSVVLKSQLNRAKIVDFLLLATFAAKTKQKSKQTQKSTKPPIFGCLPLLSFVHS